MGRPKSAGIGLYEERPDNTRARTIGEMIEASRNLIQRRLEAIEREVAASKSRAPDEFQAQELFRICKALLTLEKEQGKRLGEPDSAKPDAPKDPPSIEDMTEEQIARALRVK